LKPSNYPESIFVLPAVYLRKRSAYSPQPDTGEQVYLPTAELEAAAKWATPTHGAMIVASAKHDTNEIAVRQDQQEKEEPRYGYAIVHEIGHIYLHQLALRYPEVYKTVSQESEAACIRAELQDRLNRGTGLVGLFGEHIFSDPQEELFGMMFGIRFTFGEEHLAKLVEPYDPSMHKAFKEALAVTFAKSA